MNRRIIEYLTAYSGSFWVLSIGWFVSALGFALSIPFISIYFHSHLNLSLSEIGLFFGVMAIIRSLFQVIGGEVSDRIERRVLLIYSQMIRGLAFALLALAIFRDWGFFVVASCLLLSSIFGAIFQPVANAMVSDLLPSRKRLEGYAIIRSAGNLGWAFGPAIGGYMAGYSYGSLFILSSGLTFAGGLVLWLFLNPPRVTSNPDRFKFSDLIAIKSDPYLASHCVLIFLLYLVVAQLIAPFSVYAVDMVGISKEQLGLLYTLNGLLVVSAQIPTTRLLSRYRLTVQLALGSFIYAVGYGIMGFGMGVRFFVFAMVIVTLGEIFMSPPSLTLTSRLAPDGKLGRYMGIFGFCVSSGWSLGPVYGGVILDHFGHNHVLAWIVIASLAVFSGLGYLLFSRKVPERFNQRIDPDSTG